MHAGEKGHARPGWTTSRRGQDSPWKSKIRMTEDRDKWRKYVHGVANPRIEDGERSDQIYNRRILSALARNLYDNYSAKNLCKT